MKASEQGLGDSRRRYQVVPRTLIFLTSSNPERGDREILLLKGAPTKRLWAGKYNGIGGHVEADEDVLSAAQRELVEETGLRSVDLTLRGVINVAAQPGGETPQGVAVFLFTGETGERSVAAGEEGELDWLPLSALNDYPMVDDLYRLIPLLTEQSGPVFGHYAPNADGTMHYAFSP